MTINIQKASNVSVVGYHNHKNCKPVYCIDTGEIFASTLDAAEANNVCHPTMSSVLNGKTKTCNGRRFCFVCKIMEYLEEITEANRVRAEKIANYDAMIAEQNAKKEAEEAIARHKAKCEELRIKLERETQLLAEAEVKYNDSVAV